MNKKTLSRRKRLSLIFVLVSLIFFILIVKLLFIQVIDAEKYKTLAAMQRTRDIPIPATRGSVYDRNGTILAFSIKSFTMWARPSEIIDLEATLDDISKVVTINKDVIIKTINDDDISIIKVKREINKETADIIANLTLPGIWVTEDIQRAYPFDNFASHIIGHTSIDIVGISGIEQEYNDILTGTPGKYLVSTDASGRQLAFGTDKKYMPVDGYNVVLTIDEIIQHYLEIALQKAYFENEAKNVSGIVMDVKTGEILAMSSKPDYNLNKPRIPYSKYYDVDVDSMTDSEKVIFWNSMWKNQIISSLYEPGSVFKIITAAAGLEENVVTPYTLFNEHGYLMIDGVRINCWSHKNPHGEQTLTEALENSCNPVFMEIGIGMGKETFYSYIENFGFKEKTNIGLPAETNSLVTPLNKVTNVDAATMSFGQGISITPMQMIKAAGAIANNGIMMEPYIVKAITDNYGNVIDEFTPKEIKQVISEKTSVEMRLMMESVVDNGSGANAKIEGIRIGGKTGTSEKIVDGEYTGDKTYSSFIAFAPVDDPQVIILIVIDEPSFNSYGSVIAAPVAKDVLEDTFRYLGINPLIEYNGINIEIPDFNGLTYKKAKEIAKKYSIVISVTTDEIVNDDFVVIDQYPKAGKLAQEGSMVILQVERGADNEID